MRIQLSKCFYVILCKKPLKTKINKSSILVFVRWAYFLKCLIECELFNIGMMLSLAQCIRKSWKIRILEIIHYNFYFKYWLTIYNEDFINEYDNLSSRNTFKVHNVTNSWQSVGLLILTSSTIGSSGSVFGAAFEFKSDISFKFSVMLLSVY